MNSYNTKLIRKVTLLSVFFFVIGCKKKDNLVGAELHDDKLNVDVIDTLSLITYSQEQDSVRSSGLTISTLGSYNDPTFGVTNSSIFTHLRLSADNVNFAPSGTSADIEIDSVVLALEFSDYYGNLDPQTFEIYELLDDIYTDSTYYSNYNGNVSATNIVASGFGVITPNPDSNVLIDGKTLDPQLRIKIDNSFGQKIIDESGNSTISNNDNFLQFIKGIQIKTNDAFASGQGAILLFDLLSQNSKLTIYYRDTVINDTNSFDLLINSSCARINSIQHNYSSSAVQSILSDSTLGDNEFYIQGLQGVRSFIEIPHLTSLKDSNIIINKASLILPANYSGSTYEPIEQLLILRNGKDENGVNQEYILPDQLTYGLAGIGGTYDETNDEYEFVITRYINNILNENFENNKLTLQSASQMVTPNRVILFGKNGTSKPRLVLTYTKY